ncbi:MAG: hypothetical protein IPJ88_12470 [Myxococcales bacterium]|nr:MAG: hypothetical protein IPJ88_12470 [Myxococcales bacterium]
MQQYFRCKAEYPDAVLFFRLGDFYEMFCDDAERVSKLLDITLTSRGKDKQGQTIPMAGVPHHAASSYIAKLLQMGESVALCEQMADPTSIKGVVPREVVRVITPGLILEEDALDAKAENFLVALIEGSEHWGLCALEASTARLVATQLLDSAQALVELARLSPSEILLFEATANFANTIKRSFPNAVLRTLDAMTSLSGELTEDLSCFAEQDTKRQIAELDSTVQLAVYAALNHARKHQPKQQLTRYTFERRDNGRYMQLDPTAVRNLELVCTLEGERRGSLLHLLDQTQTAMGARLFRRRLVNPLSELSEIEKRHNEVEVFIDLAPLRERLRRELKAISDLERVMTRIETGVGDRANSELFATVSSPQRGCLRSSARQHRLIQREQSCA